MMHKNISFQEFDELLKEYPQNLTKLIYDFYTTECQGCGSRQKYCIECEKYQCYCIKTVFRCNVEECQRLLCCIDGEKICNCNACPNDKYLCSRCWRIDIHTDIIEDIRINGN